MIKKSSMEFKNFKEAVDRNKLKCSSASIDSIVGCLIKNNIKISKIRKNT